MNRVAVITGASGGIGRETACQLAEKGWSLVIAARRESALLEVSATCLDRGAKAVLPVPCDVCVPEHLVRLRKATEDQKADEIALVNCAGFAEFGDYHETAPSNITLQIQVNLIGTMLACREIIPLMLDNGNGRIVNVLSIAAKHVFPGAAAYAASKAGGLAFTQTIAAEYRTKGINITALIPGSVDTDLWIGKDWAPDRSDMLSAEAVATAIVDILQLPSDRNVDELVLMPPKGIL
jgi:short-subunit dehydrogenase